MRHHLVLRVVTKLLIPMILLFAVYVQFHGDFGPGGGFQAGVIFGSGIIVYGLIFGAVTARRVISPTVLRVLAAGGVLLYTGVGVAGLLLGGNFLEYRVLAAQSTSGEHIGIFLIELGVGVTVASVMIGLFYAFTGYRHIATGDER